jgi:hypothetical protein
VNASGVDAQPDLRLSRSVRVTSILTAILGPLMILTAGVTHLVLRLFEQISFQPGVAMPQFQLLDFILAFAADSSSIMFVLGLAFLVGGTWSWRRPATSPAVLSYTALIGLVGMLSLTVQWCWLALEHEAGVPMLLAGVLGHGVQAAMIYKTWRFLQRADVRAAVA